MKVYKNEVSIDPKQNQHFYPIPSNLDIRGLILYDAVEGARCESDPKKQVDRAIFILGMLSIVRFQNWDEYDNDLSFVRISSKVLNKYVKNYKKYLQYFMDKGIIEANNSYQENGYCKGYRFSNKYRGRLLKYEPITDPDFCLRITELDKQAGRVQIQNHRQNILEDNTCSQSNVINEYPSLFKTLNRISIDIYGAGIQLLQEVENKEITKLKANKYFYYFTSVYYGNIYFKKDNKGGRLHTTITSFPKRYREFLTHRKVSKWGKIDVKNCQPFLLGTLLYKNSLSSYLLEEYKDNKIPIMLPAYDDLPKDAKMYIESCSNGILYEDFVKKIQEHNGNKFTRNQIKKKIVQITFEPVHWSDDEKKVFKAKHPSVFEFIKTVNGEFRITKRMSKKPGKGEPDENKLAHILQRAESHIILDHVVKQIVEIDEEIPILTIHDELMVPEEKMELVVEIMKDEFQKMTNITPSFSCKVLEPLMKYRAA